MKGDSTGNESVETRRWHTRPAKIAMMLFDDVTRAMVLDTNFDGRPRLLCSLTYQDSKTEYRHDVETPAIKHVL